MLPRSCTFFLVLILPLFFSHSSLHSSEKISIRLAWEEMMKGASSRDFSTCTQPCIDLSTPAFHPYSPFFTKRVGFLLLAGGQGSRLGCDCPKGMVPIPPSNKTLFEIFLRRMVGFFRTYHEWPYCAIMTSDETDAATQAYLKEHHFFGVPEDQIFFFRQSSLTLLNEQGNPFYENGKLAVGPDGNGRALYWFHALGLYQTWKEKGVEALMVLPIDNPLMDPLLPSLFQPVLEGKVSASLATLKRRTPQEKVGVFFLQEGKPHVIEYSEIPDSLRNATTADGSLLYAWANISVFCLSMEHVERLAYLPLPLHFAKKMQNSLPIYKPEFFIFDHFPRLSSFSLIPLDRKRYFSPIKAKTGEDSLEQASLAFRCLQEEQAKRSGYMLDEGERADDIDPADLYIGN